MSYVLVNEAKKQRAIKILKDQARARGEDMVKFVVSEAEVRALYEKFGGFVEESIEEAKVEETSDATVEAEAPRRRSHRA